MKERFFVADFEAPQSIIYSAWADSKLFAPSSWKWSRLSSTSWRQVFRFNLVDGLLGLVFGMMRFCHFKSVRIGTRNRSLTSWKASFSFCLTWNTCFQKSNEYAIQQETKNVTNYNDLTIWLNYRGEIQNQPIDQVPVLSFEQGICLSISTAASSLPTLEPVFTPWNR